MFLSKFLSYLMVFIVFVIVIVAAVFLGIFLRKNKSAKQAKQLEADTKSEE